MFFANSYTKSQEPISTKEFKKNYNLIIKKIKSIEQLPPFNVFRILNGEIEVILTPPTEIQFLNYLSILQDALNKYPTELIHQHLKEIFIGGSYHQNGGIISGLYNKDIVYLFYNSQDGDNSSTFLEQTFHHEFSSILIHAYDFPAFDWLKLNPENFEYIINPIKINEYMNSIETYKATELQLTQGLVSSYGQSNAENDINSYIELIFTQPKKMQALVNTYPIIKLKYQMIKKFYLSISPQFHTTFSF